MFTPSGRSIQARGIEPDFIMEVNLLMKLILKYETGETQLNKFIKKDTSDKIQIWIFYIYTECASRRYSTKFTALKIMNNLLSQI